MKNESLGKQIVVMTHGFVYVGSVFIEGKFVRIEGAKNIRRWGTTKGLGQLVQGPTKDTILEDCGTIIAPMSAVIHLIKTQYDY